MIIEKYIFKRHNCITVSCKINIFQKPAAKSYEEWVMSFQTMKSTCVIKVSYSICLSHYLSLSISLFHSIYLSSIHFISLLYRSSFSTLSLTPSFSILLFPIPLPIFPLYLPFFLSFILFPCCLLYLFLSPFHLGKNVIIYERRVYLRRRKKVAK